MKKLTYKDAGVDIEKGDEFVQKIKNITKNNTIGLFGSVFDPKSANFKDPLYITSTDGVGTKLKIAQMLNNHRTIGIDLVAMCVNDVLCHGAQALHFLDYIGTSKLDIAIASEIIEGIHEGCTQAECELVGGETAEMPNMYHGKDYDLAGFCLAAVERQNMLPRMQDIQNGNVLVAIPSSGVHSNGFSLLNHIIKERSITNESFLNTLLTPTRIYTRQVLNILESHKVHAVAHITGSGLYDNIIRVIPKNLDVRVNRNNVRVHNIFKEIQKLGNIEEDEMYRTFNMGIGMCFIMEQFDAESLISKNPEMYIFGSVITK